MDSRIIEATSGMCWCKFLVARYGPDELNHLSQVDTGRPVLPARCSTDLLVLDLATKEGAVFTPGRCAKADLRKHDIWVSPLFSPFLDWLYKQDITDLANLPDLVELAGEGGVRPEGPLDTLLKMNLRSEDPEIRALARTVWLGTHNTESMPAGTPPTLADLRRWVGNNPDASVRGCP